MVAQQRLEGTHPRGEVWSFVLKPVYKRARHKDFSRCFHLHFTHDRERCQLSTVRMLIITLQVRWFLWGGGD